MELTTVADDEAVLHAGSEVHCLEGLVADTRYDHQGHVFRTLPAPGERLATFATANDVHFGETVCGLIEGSDVGPVFRSDPGEDPYPEVMNRAAVAEIQALPPAVVVVKGDLTSGGRLSEYERFLEVYGGAFGDRLFHVRGNHDAYDQQRFVPRAPIEIELPGARHDAAGPFAEVACVKDYPGAWAEYRVFEGGLLQIHRRISAPDALRWTEKTRGMFSGHYADYAFGGLGDRCFYLPWTAP